MTRLRRTDHARVWVCAVDGSMTGGSIRKYTFALAGSNGGQCREYVRGGYEDRDDLGASFAGGVVSCPI